MQETSQQSLWQKLNRETARIAWRELQTFYAAGQLVYIDSSLDLVQIAVEFSRDNKPLIADLMAQKQLGLVEQEQANAYQQNNSELWAVVVAPWVLVQETKAGHHE